MLTATESCTGAGGNRNGRAEHLPMQVRVSLHISLLSLTTPMLSVFFLLLLLGHGAIMLPRFLPIPFTRQWF